MATPPTVAAAVFRLQTLLLDHGAPSERHLLTAAALLSRPDYADVVTERSIASLCGFPLCRNPLPEETSNSKGGGARFRISLSEHRVYDLEERGKFCSEECLVHSRAYEASLPEERPFLIDARKVQTVLDSFSTSENEKEMERERERERFSELKLVPKESEGEGFDLGLKGDVSVEDWIGPPDAIEGYVPKFKSKMPLLYEEGFGETGFRSEIIFGDEGSGGFSSAQTEKISDQISRKLQSIVLDETESKKTSKGSKSKSSSKSRKSKAEEKPSLSVGEQRNASGGEGHSQQNGLILKPSLKKKGSSSTPRTQNQSVKWADEERCKAKESSVKSDVLSEEDAAVRSLRVASAEACAAALSHAAEIASSGKSEVEDAVSEAGIVILPQQSHGTEKEPHENMEDDTEEIGREVVKWPQKPVLLETDMFEVDDSWHDTPPEGFSLDLSPFGTMWMAIFGWVTRSTLCYIYGHDESMSEEFSEVKGQEYSRRMVLMDGKSAEIRKALEGFVCRALPSLVSDLRLPVPVSTLEKHLGRLMDTMTFAEALPALRTRQWNALVLLFLDALSVHHLPSISSIMGNRSLLRQKVINGAQLEAAHYDSMIDVFLPLGRSPSLSFEKNSR